MLTALADNYYSKGAKASQMLTTLADVGKINMKKSMLSKLKSIQSIFSPFAPFQQKSVTISQMAICSSR